MDPGWYMLKVLEHFNLAWNIKTPENLPRRSNLVKIDLQDVDYRASGSISTPVKEI